eukprot:gene3414-5959_t
MFKFNLLLVFLLLIAYQQIAAIPAECVSSVSQVLSTGAPTDPCNPRYTCEHKCKNGQCTVYLDIRKFGNHILSDWNDDFVENTLKEHKFGLSSRIYKSNAKTMLADIVSKFAKICKGGAKITQKDMENASSKISKAAAKATADSNVNFGRGYTAEKKRYHANNKRDAYNGLKNIIGIFRMKLNAGNFGYCSCADFGNSLTGIKKQIVNLSVAKACKRKCNSGAVTLDDNDIVAVENLTKDLELEIESLELE